MEILYAVQTATELNKYQQFFNKHKQRTEAYIEYLQNDFQVKELPRSIVFTTEKIATHSISDISIPAYTNDYRVIFTPDIETWRNIYLKQLENVDRTEENEPIIKQIASYYQQTLSEHHILQILGHELAHHSNYFLEDDDDDASIWFEEGMVEYISRKYFLTESEFEQEKAMNQHLVRLFSEKYGQHSLEEFGASTYEGDFASIFFEYWRSVLKVMSIIEKFDDNLEKIFASYHQWDSKGQKVSLLEWFDAILNK